MPRAWIACVYMFCGVVQAADKVYLSDFLGQPPGAAADAPNHPFTELPFGSQPYGFGVDCPGNFASSKITFQDVGVFEKGIGQHPYEFGIKQIDFDLRAIRVNTKRDLASFNARVGVDFPTSVQNNGGTFRVLVDGVLKSEQLIGGRLFPSVPIAVQIAGASQLSLVTVRSGDWNSNHMCWGEASIALIGDPCPADLNGDRFVDDGDFSIFAVAYNILDCVDASMPFGCPADINNDQLVDDADFTLFVVPYNELICP